MKSIYGKCLLVQGYCVSVVIGVVFSYYNCGLFVDSIVFYFGVCMGRYDCYCDLVCFVEIIKNIVGLLFVCCIGYDVVVSVVFCYFCCFVGE